MTSPCDACGERYPVKKQATRVEIAFDGQPEIDDLELSLCPDCGLMLSRDLRTVQEVNRDQRRLAH